MQKLIGVVLVLFASASTAVAQAKVARADGGGGAYYEFMMGLQLEIQGDGPGATAAYLRAERLDPASAEIPAALAELYARLNRPVEAIAAGERAVKANSTNPEANWILGSLYARMSEMPSTRQPDRRTYTERAIASLEKANRNAHPSMPTMLGRLYIADDQYDKAIAMLAPFVTDQPDQIEAVAMLAEAYQAADRDSDAIALLEKSVQDAPELYSTLGQVYQDAGRWSDAVRAFAGAVEERPQSLPLRSQWATALLNVGESQRAREVLEAGSAGSSRNQRALYLLSEAQRRTHDFAAAEVTARRLIALDARALGGPRQLAQIFLDQREHQKIVALLEPIVTARLGAADAADLSSDTFRSTYFDLASAYDKLRQFDKAIAMLRQARTLSPTDPLVEVRLARSQQDAGRGDDAVKTLQTAVAKF
ncbi:MAG: tetratricopeptide repeat protein, partial [Vicinamibacterales bacterium]